MNARRVAVVVSSLLLMLATAPPAGAQSQVTVSLEIAPYPSGAGYVEVRLACASGGPFLADASLGQPAVFDLAGETGPCFVADVGFGDPGDVGEWGGWSADPAQVGIGGEITLALERVYTGEDPRWDGDPSATSGRFEISSFTVDRVELNANGGIRVFGTVWCPAVEGTPFESMNIVGMDWQATQYVGRRTAIHATWSSDQGLSCWVPDAGPVTWRTMSSASRLPDGEWWVYGTDGRFGSGSIVIQAGITAYSYVAQYWDPRSDDYRPDCTTDTSALMVDTNGDGFCAYYTDNGARAQATLRTISVKVAGGGGRRR